MARRMVWADEIGRCPLRGGHRPPAEPVPGAAGLVATLGPGRYLIWRDETGWVTAYGTPECWSLIASALPCWHFAVDCITRFDPPDENTGAGGWITPVLRPNQGLQLPDGQIVCDICYADLAEAAPCPA